MVVGPNRGEGWEATVWPYPRSAGDEQCLRCGVWAEDDQFIQVRALDNTTKHACMLCIDEYTYDREQEHKAYVKRYH